jgi:glycosyltransferase involved in cell wall biosynthesis
MNIDVSFIIPTHNRSGSLKKMLEGLERQSYSSQNFEVIVVADGCKDDTAEMVRSLATGFQLKLCELPGLGPGAARNTGALVATGKLLIFVDDDMEVCNDFIVQHLSKHTHENCVVIGYCPLNLESKASLYRKVMREWWELKFNNLRKKGHRFTYEDLTSGNFSISSHLFKKLKGFNTVFPCRDDYELGYRLIEAGAEFCFASNAKSLHNDKVTDLRRSLLRKKAEARADLEFQKLHPELKNYHAHIFINGSFLKSALLYLIKLMPLLCDRLANFGFVLMNCFEKFALTVLWLRMNYLLHQYWYLRGLIETAGSVKQLRQLILSKKISLNDNQKLSIDLEQGLKKVKKELDRLRPLELNIYYNKKFIGTIEHEPGSEPIKGIHLPELLKEKFSDEVFSVINPGISIKQPINNTKENFLVSQEFDNR